jgi:hypothetical protein
MLLGQLPCSHLVERHEQHERHGAEEFGIALYVGIPSCESEQRTERLLMKDPTPLYVLTATYSTTVSHTVPHNMRAPNETNQRDLHTLGLWLQPCFWGYGIVIGGLSLHLRRRDAVRYVVSTSRTWNVPL